MASRYDTEKLTGHAIAAGHAARRAINLSLYEQDRQKRNIVQDNVDTFGNAPSAAVQATCDRPTLLFSSGLLVCALAQCSWSVLLLWLQRCATLFLVTLHPCQGLACGADHPSQLSADCVGDLFETRDGGVFSVGADLCEGGSDVGVELCEGGSDVGAELCEGGLDASADLDAGRLDVARCCRTPTQSATIFTA
ncbi:unnamed protein product [Cercospora beticola]|nr:unnamed protein product [Cercospora beticola]